MAANKGQSDHTDYLFIAAKNFAIQTFQEGMTPNNALKLASKALWFGNHLIEHFETIEPVSEPLACAAGCHYCCFYQVLLTPLETLLIGNYVETTYTEQAKQDLVRRIERTLQLTDGKSLQEKVAIWHDTPCIFLSNGRCSVYDDRPLICAAWHSLDFDQCKEAFESNNPWAGIDGYPYRYHIFQTIREGLREACTHAGRQADTLPIAKATKHYFEHQSPIESWINGDKVFE
jgi:Fe-S-cluster containining protein